MWAIVGVMQIMFISSRGQLKKSGSQIRALSISIRSVRFGSRQSKDPESQWCLYL